MIPSRVLDILRSVGEKPQLPPTIIYNEGWMLRLALEALSHTRISDHPLHFLEGSTWISEASLPTAFRPRQRADKLSESYTHADGVIGHVEVDPSGRGYLGLSPAATQFVAIEAKMFSPLSAGVRNAPTFHQAARTVACMAELIRRSKRSPSDFENLGFYVLAPQESIDRGTFRLQMSKEHIRVAVEERAATYGGEPSEWYAGSFAPLLDRIRIECLSWEGILATLLGTADGDELTAFYKNCLKFNRPKRLAK